ncbi:MAG: polysaccharide biosynthesis C-terminal domain-containing protein [Rhizobiales bacterium]|nr:polysaccharide biosynthesis C-terminal domain-containing protein [Hyphomicrobiales bacterium]
MRSDLTGQAVVSSPRQESGPVAVERDARAAPADGAGASTATGRSGELGRRLARGSAWAFLAYVGGAALTFVAQLVIARLMGATSYGVYSYVVAWSSVLAYGSTLGFNVALLRFVPAYAVNEQWPLARGIILFALKWSLAAALATAVVGAVIVLASSERLHPDLTHSMLIGLAAVPLITMYLVGGAVLRVFGGVVSALLPERIVRDSLLLTFIALIALTTSRPPNATLATAALLVSSIATVGLVAIIARRLWLPGLRGVRPAYAPRDWWPALMPLMVMSAVDVLMTRTGVMLLGWTGNIREAGIFAVGFNVAMLLVLPRVAVSTMFAPTVSDLHARGDRQALQKVFANASTLSLAGSALLALPLLFLMGPLLRWFGEDFASGSRIAYILVIGQVFAAATGPQQSLLTMTGHERAAAALMIASAGLNILGCVLGIPRYGPIGAAMATTATMVAWNVAMAIYIHRHLGLVPGLVSGLGWRRREPG